MEKKTQNPIHDGSLWCFFTQIIQDTAILSDEQGAKIREQLEAPGFLAR